MILLLAMVTFLCVLAAAVWDMRNTEAAIRNNRHSSMTTPSAGPRIGDN